MLESGEAGKSVGENDDLFGSIQKLKLHPNTTVTILKPLKDYYGMPIMVELVNEELEEHRTISKDLYDLL